MAIQKTITFDEFIFNQYLSDFEGNNFSKYIQKLVVLGVEALSGDAVENKRKLISLLNENEKLSQENKNLRMRSQKGHSCITKEDVADKYQLENKHFEQLEIAKKVLERNPTYLRGQYDFFKNEFNIHSLSFGEFKNLIGIKENGVSKNET